MPIRINLLAEAKAAEELRRHDPVKRAIFCGAFLVVLMLVWSSSLQLENLMANRDLTSRQTQIESRTNEFQRVQADQKKIAEVQHKLDALKKLTNSRFLQGNLLNALQQITEEGVQLTRVTVSQTYFSTPGSPSVTNANGVIQGRPGQVKEKIAVALDAKDSSASPGDQVNKFKETLARHAYFKSALDKTNGIQLLYLSPIQTGSDGKPNVLFTLECNFQEHTR
jgi:hypothetical protein